MGSDSQHPSTEEQEYLVEMFHLRLGVEVAGMAERYGLSTCTTIRLMGRALSVIHTGVHLAEVEADPRWN